MSSDGFVAAAAGAVEIVVSVRCKSLAEVLLDDFAIRSVADLA